MNRNVRSFIDGSWTDGATTADLVDPYTGASIARVHCADTAQVEAAVSGLVAAQAAGPEEPVRRQRVLAEASRLIAQRREELVALMTAEAGFTRADGEREVDRAAETLRLCGEEAVRLTGDMVPIDGAPGGAGRVGFTLRVPVGVVCAITPFNSPLNTVTHKVGPAIAAGNAIVLKPSLLTPATSETLVRILLDAGLPSDRIALVHGPGTEVGEALVSDQRIAFYTFTGSTAVGTAIQRAVGIRRTQLELGGLSSTVLCSDADLDMAVPKCVSGAFRKAGQVCTSVQRLYVQRSIADDVVSRIADAANTLVAGDPRDPATDVGPMITEAQAARVEGWVAEAVGRGAVVRAGGRRRGAVHEPTVLTNVDPAMRVVCEEIFGPVVVLRTFDALDDALDEVDDTPYGLAAGIFTTDLGSAYTAARRLRMGSVHVNETSSSRVDLMPYGGVKASGFGQEGPHYAAREMTEERLVSVTFG